MCSSNNVNVKINQSDFSFCPVLRGRVGSRILHRNALVLKKKPLFSLLFKIKSVPLPPGTRKTY